MYAGVYLLQFPFLYIQPHTEDNYHVKTISGIRRLPLNSTQLKEIKKYIHFRQKYLEAYEKDHDFFIHDSSGEPIRKSLINGWLRTIELEFLEFGRTNTRKISPYIFRYSSAWHYYNRKKDLYGVSKLLGHKSIKQTEEYLGLTEQQKFDALVRMML